MFVTLFLIVICLVLYKIKLQNVNYFKKYGIPFENPIPIIGSIWDVIVVRKNMANIVAELYNKYNGPYFGVSIFNKSVLVIRCPHLIKQILVKDFDYFQDRFLNCDEKVDEISANMMFFMKHPKWKDIRPKTSTIFSSSKLKCVYPQMQKVALNMVTFIKASNESVIELNDISMKYTTEAVCSSAFGIDAHSFQTKDTPFVSATRTVLGNSALNRLKQMYSYGIECASLEFKRIRKSSGNFFTEFILDILEHRKNALKNEKRRLIDFLVSYGSDKMKQMDVIGLGAQFFMSVSESLSLAVSLALYELSLNKTIQDKLRDEIYSNLDDDYSISYESLNGMDYLDKIYHETLRKYPVLPILGRSCVRDYKIPNTAVVIEKGVDVILPLLGIHHDPKYYPTPELFDPERFSQDNIRDRQPYSYLPFGEGPRNCIGQKFATPVVKLAIAHVIKSFEIVTCKESRKPLEFDPRTFSLYANEGIYVQFNRID